VSARALPCASAAAPQPVVCPESPEVAVLLSSSGTLVRRSLRCRRATLWSYLQAWGSACCVCCAGLVCQYALHAVYQVEDRHSSQAGWYHKMGCAVQNTRP